MKEQDSRRLRGRGGLSAERIFPAFVSLIFLFWALLLLQADWTLFGGKDLVQTRLTATWSTVRVTPSQVLSRCASHHPFAVHSVYEGTVLVRIGSVRTLCGI